MAERVEAKQAIPDVLSKAVDAAAAGTVFGEPITRDGITVVPVARVRGKGGGGGGGGGRGARGGEGGEGQRGGGRGGGARLAMSAKPAGVFVIRGDNVAWRPSLDLNKVIMGGQIVAAVALLMIRSAVRARSMRRPSKRR